MNFQTRRVLVEQALRYASHIVHELCAQHAEAFDPETRKLLSDLTAVLSGVQDHVRFAAIERRS